MTNAGNNSHIFYRISNARDTVMVASGSKDGMCILDNNYKATFNFMVMLWVSKVVLSLG